MERPTLHCLGLFHTQTTKEYSPCAFTQKVYGLCKMMHEDGWNVIHYGTEGSNPLCSENVQVLDYDTFYKLEGHKDWKKDGFNPDTASEIYRKWTDNCISELRKRIKPKDILCITFGLGQVEQANAFPEAIIVETGIGYPNGFAPFQVFESHAWRNIYYGGDERKNTPRAYDMVIPNYLDMNDYPFYPREKKKDYAIMVCRPIPKKGSNIASDACKAAGMKLYIAGQGGLLEGVEAEHLGVLDKKELAKWVGEAKVLFQPTYYVEPFGTITIEAMALGTPVIATDFGVFPETVIHGKTGYRYRIVREFVWAINNINKIDPAVCRKFAEENFSMERVKQQYTDYFELLADLHRDGSKGFYELDTPCYNLNALNKYYP
jgi:glycosyltransferase involved in cell wall biosynthesis